MATYVYEDFRVTFTPRADESYDVRATDATGRHRGRRVHRPAERPRTSSRRCCGWPRTAPHAGPLPASATTRDVGGDGAAAGHRRRAPRRLAGRGVARAARSARLPGRARQRAECHGHGTRMTLSLAAAPPLLSVPVGVPLRAAPLPRQPAAHPARAPARERRPGAATGDRGRGPDPRHRRQPAATSRRSTSTVSASASSRRSRRSSPNGQVRLDWLEPASPREPAPGPSRWQLPRRSTTSATATSRRTATASSTSRIPTTATPSRSTRRCSPTCCRTRTRCGWWC